MEVLHCSKIYKTTRCHNHEECNHHLHHYENIKSQKCVFNNESHDSYCHPNKIKIPTCISYLKVLSLRVVCVCWCPYQYLTGEHCFVLFWCVKYKSSLHFMQNMCFGLQLSEEQAILYGNLAMGWQVFLSTWQCHPNRKMSKKILTVCNTTRIFLMMHKREF
jgi:hypothetical protein